MRLGAVAAFWLAFLAFMLPERVLSQTPQTVRICVNDGSVCNQTSLSSPIPVGSGRVSTANSTQAPLLGAATFTGDWEDVSAYNSVTAATKSDQDGTLYIEFSSDASTAQSSLAFAVAANTNEVHRFTITRKYYRLRYVNGSVAQTTFDAQSLYGDKTLLTSALNTQVQQDADAIVSRIIDPDLSVSEGLFQGYSLDTKFGQNPSVDSTGEDIWGGGNKAKARKGLYNLSAQEKEKRRGYAKLANEARRRQIRCTTDGRLFRSVTEAACAYGVTTSHITNWAKGIKSRMGLEFSYIDGGAP